MWSIPWQSWNSGHVCFRWKGQVGPNWVVPVKESFSQKRPCCLLYGNSSHSPSSAMSSVLSLSCRELLMGWDSAFFPPCPFKLVRAIYINLPRIWQQNCGLTGAWELLEWYSFCCSASPDSPWFRRKCIPFSSWIKQIKRGGERTGWLQCLTGVSGVEMVSRALGEKDAGL